MYLLTISPASCLIKQKGHWSNVKKWCGGGEERVPAPQRLSTLTQKVFDNFQKKVLVGRWRQTIKEAPGWNTWRSWLDISALLWRGEEELQLIVLQRVYCFFFRSERGGGGRKSRHGRRQKGNTLTRDCEGDSERLIQPFTELLWFVMLPWWL